MTTTTVHLGSLTVTRPGLGCMGMSLAYGRPDRDSATATLHRALELGVTLFDTADVYGRGGNETFVGSVLASAPAEVTIATKVGLRANLLGVPNRVDGRPSYLREAIDASLRRLGRERIDLLYLHRVDPDVPVEESIGVLAEAVRAGKVREIGISEATSAQIERANGVHPLAALQTEWSLFSRDIEADVLPTCRGLGIAVVPYAPLGRGMLSATPAATDRLPLLDFRRTLPRWRRANLAANLAALEPLRRIAADHDTTPAQVALKWLMDQGPDVVPIPGTTKPRNLERNVAARDLVLTDADRQDLGAITASGARYARDTQAPGVG